MNITLDGQPHATGSLEEVRAVHLQLEPDFDVNRLQYTRASVNAQATKDIAANANQVRASLVPESDERRRGGWTLKGLAAVMVKAAADSDYMTNVLAPAVTAAFADEASRRNDGVTGPELMDIAAVKMLETLRATAVVEGNQRGAEQAVDAAVDNEAVQQVYAQAKANQAADAGMLAVLNPEDSDE